MHAELKRKYASGRAGYTDGSGVVRGLGRGLAGAVGLPVSGALAAISAVSAGIAAATGVSPIAVNHRPLPHPGMSRTVPFPERTLVFRRQLMPDDHWRPQQHCADLC